MTGIEQIPVEIREAKFTASDVGPTLIRQDKVSFPSA